MESAGYTEGIRALGQAVNNMHALTLAYQKSSEQWRRDFELKLDDKLDHINARLEAVCDKGGRDHESFRQEDGHLWTEIHKLAARMDVQEARKAGQLDILKPVGAFLSKHWVAIVVGAIWLANTYGLPALAQAFAPSATVQIQGAL